MTTSSYDRGLHALGNSVYAYLQPDGSWGWSNAGLIVDGDQSLLVDTLFDVGHTRSMLDEMRDATPAASTIDIVVNTHANGDHCWGNQLVADARIIASRNSAAEMLEIPPQILAQMLAGAPTMGILGEYITAIFGAFDFSDIRLTPPSETFEDQLTLQVGDKKVVLIDVGPAHTRGDVLVHVPSERTVFTGDILFHQAHPVIWAGPVDNWVTACQTILDLDVETVVPGHGPLADKDGVRQLQGYLEWLVREGRARHEAGMSVLEAARDLDLEPYASWSESERLVVNLVAVYRQLGASDLPTDVVTLLRLMAELAHERGLYGL